MEANLLLERRADLPAVTLGDLVAPNLLLRTVERPWRGNAPGESCIPAGVYRWEHWDSPDNGRCLIIHNEDDTTLPPARRLWRTKADGDRHGARWGIQVHVANVAREVEGCIGPGLDFGTPYGEIGVAESRAALYKLLAVLEDFEGGQFIVTYRGAPQWP